MEPFSTCQQTSKLCVIIIVTVYKCLFFSKLLTCTFNYFVHQVVKFMSFPNIRNIVQHGI